VTLDHALAFLIFALVAAITPGPSNVMLTGTGAVTGILRGLPCLLGVAVGMGLLIFMVGSGVGHLVLDRPLILKALNYAGAAFLLWLAWKITSAPVGEEAEAHKPVGFLGAATFQWINPKSWLVSASAAGTYLKADDGDVLVPAALIALLFVAAALPSGFVWLAFGAWMQRHLRNPRTARWFNVAMGLCLAGSVVFIVG
jgi:threonine/homoserine/homoserine lactone efflux protein